MIAEGVLGFKKCVSQMDLDSKDVEIKESKKECTVTAKEQMKSGEGETGEEDTREDNDEGAPEEAAPRNDVALFLTAILHG